MFTLPLSDVDIEWPGHKYVVPSEVCELKIYPSQERWRQQSPWCRRILFSLRI